MRCPPILRTSQKPGGHLKVIFEPYMVKMGCFWSFFAQSQKKEVSACYVIIIPYNAFTN